MKKFTVLAAFAVATLSASAASINWGFGGDVYISKDGSSAVLASEFTDSVPGYIALVYLGQNVSSLTDSVLSGLSTDDEVATASFALGTTTKTANRWQVTSASPATISSSDYSVGASFGVVYFNGSSYDYIYSGTTTVGAGVTSTLTVTDVSDNAQAVSIYGAGSSTSKGIVAVPEPSVALLGLLGSGMLIKRRRA